MDGQMDDTPCQHYKVHSLARFPSLAKNYELGHTMPGFVLLEGHGGRTDGPKTCLDKVLCSCLAAGYQKKTIKKYFVEIYIYIYIYI